MLLTTAAVDYRALLTSAANLPLAFLTPMAIYSWRR
jgi:hypothetical protein